MEISKEAILNKTHYGLKVYAYILRQYYPESVLSLKGRDCGITRNPFNGGKETLQINIVDNVARHYDTELPDFKGDIFDFASYHFKTLEEQDLLLKLNEVLHLRIGDKRGFYNEEVFPPEIELPEIAPPPSPVFSYFEKPVTNIVPKRQASLVEVFHLIKGNDFASCTSTLRKIQDTKEARKYKATQFDYVTFSGLFSKRNDKNLQKHSGLLTIDFDQLRESSIIRQALLKDEYFETELLFTSPSGDGLKWIIPVDLTIVKHQDYFKAVANYISHQYKLEVDGSGKDISRACFLPHDPNVFINPKYL
ncbi:MAG TPA: BT4734/BF3469 family protein [Aequorivita sp.]|nr:BT4734/BF3469 family protein [Aequorivita sp.]